MFFSERGSEHSMLHALFWLSPEESRHRRLEALHPIPAVLPYKALVLAHHMIRNDRPSAAIRI